MAVVKGIGGIVVALVALWGAQLIVTDVSDQGPDCVGGYSVCITTDSGEVDCDDVGETVRVEGSDPMNLDADGDGWGCEPTPDDSETDLPPWYGEQDEPSLPPWYGYN